MAMVTAAAANENGNESKGGLKEKTQQIFEDFLTRVAKLEELGAVANRYLSGFQQSLDFLRRPPIDMESKLMSKLISANDTKRMKSYIQAGCCNTLDRVQNTSKSKIILNEVEDLMEDLTLAIQSYNRSLPPLQIEDLCDQLDEQHLHQEEPSLGDLQQREVMFISSSVGIIYSMLKQDYVMQEKIVGSLNLNSTPGELESYCLMWSLRPYVNDEIMLQAWRLIR
ncbi:unnamed protein product [Linum tenue]|uniref:DUF7795 domain-containing protein n=1 Tax=Linum tenue TaxID=586396 RepID=A0AAV0RLM6_9ROSI|nr:unnamed protein product [Linum tenue]